MGLPFRALEMHGQRMWERAAVLRTLAFMQRHGMNALVLHESDLVHQIVYPRAYFDPYALWSDLPSRRGENAIFNKRAYFDHLLKLAAAAGIEVWVNVKEIGFSDEVLSLHPEVIKDGAFCPSEPFWAEYIGHKTNDLFTDFPALAGMIVSFGSQESRASRVQNKCKCALCSGEPLSRWYSRMIDCLYAPIARHGKRLAVRDFAYKPQDHVPMVEAVDRAPADVIFCIKAMAHDYYITFPDNPTIGELAPRPQWIEYDVMGQYFGWGLMPCLVLDDLRPRLAHWLERGVEGGIFRIEWERINDLDALDTLAEINLIAAAALAQDDPVDSTESCRRWLAGHGWDESAAAWLSGLLDRTLPVVRHAAYLNDFVSTDSSMLPRSIQRAWWGMEGRDSLAVWDPKRAHDLELDASKLAAYLAEKDKALRAARSLCAAVRAPQPGIAPALQQHIAAQFAHFETWVEGLSLSAKICLYSRWVASPQAPDTDLPVFAQLLDALEAYTQRLRALASDSRVPHQIVMLVDPQRAADILREGRDSLRQAQAARQPA